MDASFSRVAAVDGTHLFVVALGIVGLVYAFSAFTCVNRAFGPVVAALTLAALAFAHVFTSSAVIVIDRGALALTPTTCALAHVVTSPAVLSAGSSVRAFVKAALLVGLAIPVIIAFSFRLAVGVVVFVDEVRRGTPATSPDNGE